MAIVYDFKTGLVIDSIVTSQTTTQDNTQWSYAAIKERLNIRFDSKLPKHFERAMSKPQAQPYMHGDTHNVSYRKRTRNFNSPMPIACEINIKSCRKQDGVLILGAHCEQGIDEPFAWMDSKYQVTLNFLKSLPDKTKLIVNTRSDIVAQDDYRAELQRLDVEINILFTSRNEELNRLIEPGAPSFKRRESAVKELKTHGINAYLQHHNVSKSLKAVAI